MEDREGEEAGEPGTAPEAAMVPGRATVLVVEGMGLAEVGVGVVVEAAVVEVDKEVVAGPVMDLVADLGVAMVAAEAVVAAVAAVAAEVGVGRDTDPVRARVMAPVLGTEVLEEVVEAAVGEEVEEGETGRDLVTDLVLGLDLAAVVADTLEGSRIPRCLLLYLVSSKASHKSSYTQSCSSYKYGYNTCVKVKGLMQYNKVLFG